MISPVKLFVRLVSGFLVLQLSFFSNVVVFAQETVRESEKGRELRSTSVQMSVVPETAQTADGNAVLEKTSQESWPAVQIQNPEKIDVNNAKIDDGKIDEAGIDESLFRVIDPLVDRADLPDGSQVHRFYQAPRLLERTSDGFRVRVQGWNLFHETSNSRLKNTKGYLYSAPSNSQITVKNGTMERKNARTVVQPKGQNFRQSVQNFKTVSEFQNFYPNIDIRFRDVQRFREKDIVIRKNPKLISGEQLIFWEEWNFPSGSKVMIGDEEVLAGEKEITGHTIAVRSPDGTRFSATPPIVYDAAHADSMGIDMYGKLLSQILRVDYEKNTLSVGIQIGADYLNDSKLVYPVTIDPTYTECQEGQTSTLSCSVVDFYLRAKNGGTQTDGSSWDTNDLFLGKWLSGGAYYTRHPVVKFNVNFSQIQGSVTSATLNMYYRSLGNGTATSIDTTAKRITASWSESDVTSYNYGTFRNSAVVENPVKTLTNLTTSTAVWKSWDVLESVKKWKSGSSNYGFLLDQDPAWTTGSTPPSTWEDRLMVFDSVSVTGNTGPYLQIVSSLSKADLTEKGAIINKTTFKPGETVSINHTVINNGETDSGSFTTSYYWKTDNTGSYSDAQKVGTRPFWSILANGDFQGKLFSWTIPSNTSPGTYYFHYWIDSGGEVSESNDGNNSYYWTITVEAPLKPDIAQSTGSLNGSVVAGENINFDVTIKNIGAAAATTGGYLYYYFGPEDLNFSDSYKRGEDSFPALSVDVTSSQSFSYTVPSNTSAGTYYFYYWIDATGTIDESDESNNKLHATITVTKPKAALSLQNVSIQNSTLYGGQTISLSAQIVNNGNLDANNFSYSMRIRDVTNPSNPVYYASAEYITNLSPSTVSVAKNTSMATSFYGTLPDNCNLPLTGIYDVLFRADSNDDYGEDNEDDNYLFSSNTITINRYDYACGESPGGGGGGGGGGGTPSLDYDQDTFTDVEEKFVGTDAVKKDQKPVYDTKSSQYMAKKPDSTFSNYAGDPVNNRTGAFEFTQTDFELSGRGFPIEFTRTYNSRLAERESRLGSGWTHSYYSFYYQDPATSNIQIYHGGALASIFSTPDNGQTFAAPPGENDVLAQENGLLVYRELDGTKYYYSKLLTDNVGLLEKIVDPNGNTKTLSYTDVRSVPLLMKVTDASGRYIALTYGSDSDDLRWDKIVELKELVNAANPRIVNYEYDDQGHLIHVKENRHYAGVTDEFHRYFTYDATGRMLTYQDPRGTILYNEYDTEGRVTKQYEFNPNSDADGTKRLIYEFQYEGPHVNAPNSTHCTLVINYRNASETYSVRSCFNSEELKNYEEDGEGNIQRFVYDDQGMLTNYTDENGNVVQSEFDSKRRKTKETLPAIGGVELEMVYTYENSFNRLIQKKETAGALIKTTNYQIDPTNGNVSHIEDPFGNKEYFQYDSFGNVLKYTDRNGNVTDYAYDASGNYRTQELVNVTLADGNAQTVKKMYEYDVYGNRTKYTTPRDNVFFYEYDTRGNLRKTTDPKNQTKEYVYDLEDHRTQEKDELQRVTNYTYDRNIPATLLKVESVGSVESLIVQREYDQIGNLLKEIDPLGRATVYTYDEANRVIQKKFPLNTVLLIYDAAGNLASEADSSGQKTTYLYDARNNKKETRRYLDATNYISLKNTFDGFSRVIKKTDGKLQETQFEYDLNNRLTKEINPLGEALEYGYDKVGNKISVTTPLGHVSSYEYDQMQRLRKIINPDGKATLSFYDADTNLIKIVDRQNSDGSENSHVHTYEYDVLGRQTKDIDSYGKYIQFDYDAVGNLKIKTDRAGRIWTFIYDSFNRLTDEKDPDNHVTQYTYDKAGNKKSVVYPDLKQVMYDYDQQNRLITVTDALSGTVHYTYDAVANKLSEKNQRGFSTTYEYDTLNRLIQEKNPQNTVTNYVYDANNNRLSESIAGKMRQFQYDVLNRLSRITYPDAGTEIFTYDIDGNLKEKTDGEGKVTQFAEYDVLNRLKKKILPGGSEVTYVFDNWNNITSLTDSVAPALFIYDNENRLLEEKRTISGLNKMYTIARTYADDSQLASLTDANAITIGYEYDTRGLLKNVKKGEDVLAAYAYTSMSRPLSLTYKNGVKTDYVYDELQRVKTLAITDANAAELFKHEYTYDSGSNRTKLVENAARTVNYGYDSLDQLTTVNYANVDDQDHLAFDYDAWGNRKNFTTKQGKTSYDYDPNSNLLTGYTASSRLNVALSYDKNGSLIEESSTRLQKPLRKIQYTWDDRHRLVQMVYEDTSRPSFLTTLAKNTLSFAYDDAGNRIKKDVNGKSVYYINDGLSVLNELDNAGSVSKSIIKGLNQIAEMNAQGAMTFVHQDLLGSTMLLTDAAGKVVQEYEYDVFGSIIGKNGAAESRYLFTGQEYDPESELYYYNARYMNPRLGRFLSRDPVLGNDGDVLSKNAYIYANNNPMKYTDPTGEVAWGKLWDGTTDLFFGAVTTVFGAVEVVGGVGLATAGTAATGGLGAVATVGGGVVVAGMGANNVVAGGTQTATGAKNMWDSLWEDDGDSEAVNYTYNPAHEAINSLTERGSGGNMAAHVGYDVLDIFGGGAGAAKGLKFMGGAKVPNPYGKAGGPLHQAEVEKIFQEIKNKGLTAEKEYSVLTPSGVKGKRFLDVAGLDPVTGKPVEFYQVGKQTARGLPVSREVEAINDIKDATGIKPKFTPYNSIKSGNNDGFMNGMNSVKAGKATASYYSLNKDNK